MAADSIFWPRDLASIPMFPQDIRHLWIALLLVPGCFGPPPVAGSDSDPASTGDSTGNDPVTATTTSDPDGSTATSEATADDTTGDGTTTSETTTDDSSSSDDGSSTGEPECEPAIPMVCGRSGAGVQCGLSDAMGGFAMPALALDAYTDAAGWTDIDNWLTIQYPDLDGDGVSDICGRGETSVICARGDGAGAFAPVSAWSNDFGDAAGWGTDSQWGTMSFADLDGDGTDDLCARDPDGMRCALSNGVDGFAPSSLWTDGFSDLSGWSFAPHNWGTLQFADIDGDGDDDVCGRGNSGIVCRLSDGVGFGGGSVWSDVYDNASGWNAGPEHWGTLRFVDIDGDGAADVCGRNDDLVNCRLSNGVDGFDGGTVQATGFDNGAGWDNPDQWSTIDFPDLDGDGDADVCGRSEGGLQCALFDGTDFGAATSWTTAFSNASGWTAGARYWATIQYVDIDADGDHDVCGRSVDGLRCARSNGSDAFTDFGLGVDAFTNAGGWADGPEYWRTVRFAVATAASGDCDGAAPVAPRVPWGNSALPPR